MESPEVIKRDGSREPFDPTKIRDAIAAAAEEANIPEERRSEIVEQVAAVVIQLADEKAEIATSELKDKILSELDRVEPAVSAAWREYDQQKGEG